MALFCGRVANKYILSSIRGLPSVLGSAQYAQAAANSPKVVYKPYVPPQPEDHDHKNMRLNRPMSPHLTIYAPQLTAFTSIMHRITGMVVSGYFIALGCGALVLPHDVSHYVSMVEGLQLSAGSLLAIKFVLAAPFSYHLANGLRHLLWDTGRALTLKQVYSTGYIMLATAAIISAVIAAM